MYKWYGRLCNFVLWYVSVHLSIACIIFYHEQIIKPHWIQYKFLFYIYQDNNKEQTL